MQVTLYESVFRRRETSRRALVAFGANLPQDGMDLRQILLAARDAVIVQGLAMQAFSRMFRTPAFPAGSGDDYLNAVGAFSVPDGMTAEQILACLHRVEALAGRKRGVRWGARVLDLDLLALDDAVLPDAETQDRWRALPLDEQAARAPRQLILPHPRLQDRAFVLVPLADVAPDWRHPRTGLTVTGMLAALPPGDVAHVVAI